MLNNPRLKFDFEILEATHFQANNHSNHQTHTRKVIYAQIVLDYRYGRDLIVKVPKIA